MNFKKTLAVLLCFCVLCCGTAWADPEYSKNIAKAVRSFLKSHMENGDKSFTFDKNDGVFRTTLSGDGEAHFLGCVIVIGDGHFRSYVISPIGADPKDDAKMAAMAEFICRANYGLYNGGFELDFNDGEIRYKSYVDCSDGVTPSEEVIRRSIKVGLDMFESFLPGIKDVLFNGVSPKEAVEKIRN